MPLIYLSLLKYPSMFCGINLNAGFIFLRLACGGCGLWVCVCVSTMDNLQSECASLFIFNVSRSMGHASHEHGIYLERVPNASVLMRALEKIWCLFAMFFNRSGVFFYLHFFILILLYSLS